MTAVPASIIVAGATGATGREVVAAAVAHPGVGRVVALSRREVSFPNVDASLAAKKLQVAVIDWEALAKGFEGGGTAAVPDCFAGHTVAVMCLGTTRSDAGGGDAFARVDRDYAKAFHSAVKLRSAATVRHVAQVSCGGAAPNSWFAYLRVKAEADNALMKAGFGSVAIYRPSLLARGNASRMGERIARLALSSITVQAVAHALLHVALHSGGVAGDNPFPCVVASDAEITGFAKAFERELAKRSAIPTVTTAVEASAAGTPYPHAIAADVAVELDVIQAPSAGAAEGGPE